MNYLIIGRGGQLARAFIKTFERKGIRFTAPDESLCDITNSAVVMECVRSSKPDVIINCAAYNFVDKAEQEQDRAVAVNTSGPGLLAATAKKHNSFLIHFGTDYIFDGTKQTGLYTEDDSPHPLNVYGSSKLNGELQVRQQTDRYLILRLSWVFGDGKQNFISKLVEWSAANEYLKITCDEFSVPTYTETVVDVTLRALGQGLSGLYHLTNTGFCSRYDWAQLVLRTAGIQKFVRPVLMDSFKLPAKRPMFSAMSNKKIASTLGIHIPTWEESVIAFLK